MPFVLIVRRIFKRRHIRSGSIFVLVPLSGLLFVCLLPLAFLIIGFLLQDAADAFDPEDAGSYIGCHSSRSKLCRLESNGKVLAQGRKNPLRNIASSLSSFSSITTITTLSVCEACRCGEEVIARLLHSHTQTYANAPPCQGRCRLFPGVNEPIFSCFCACPVAKKITIYPASPRNKTSIFPGALKWRQYD